MTTAFTGRLQFTGKKVVSTGINRYFGLLTIAFSAKTTLLRCINILLPPEKAYIM